MTTPLKRLRVVILVFLLGCTVGCDQVSKHLARSELSGGGSIHLPGGLGCLQIAENPGSFLGLGNSLSAWWRRCVFTGGVGAGMIGLLVCLLVSHRLAWLSFFGLTLILAGGLGNLIDRLRQDGLVTDFIYLCAGPFHTGIFNVADLMIMIGSLTFIVSLRRSKSPSASSSENSLDNIFHRK